MDFRQVIDAKTPQAALTVEGEDARVDSRYVYSMSLVDSGLLIYSIFEGCSKTIERRTARVGLSSI